MLKVGLRKLMAKFKSLMQRSKTPNENKTTKITVILPIIVALIGFFGALISSYFGATLNSKTTKEITQLSYKNELLQQRIKIIDRAAHIFGKSPGIQDIWILYKKNLVVDSDKSLELSKMLAEYNAEFNAIINLSAIYFGPKTHESLKAMGVKRITLVGKK